MGMGEMAGVMTATKKNYKMRTTTAVAALLVVLALGLAGNFNDLVAGAAQGSMVLWLWAVTRYA